MKSEIAIIDYNAGNIASVSNALKRLGYAYVVTRDPKIILTADKVIFPGQGRAAPAMKDLKADGLDKVIKKIMAPFLGICLGMQLLLPFSEEDDTECLGIIDGKVKKFSVGTGKVPQIGWNTFNQRRVNKLFNGIPDTAFAYFVNSFYVDTADEYVLAYSQYGNTRFASVIKKNNFYGTQFHPEKSGSLGVEMLKNFCEIGSARPSPALLIPAIDIIGGKCVRLYQGNYDKQITYGSDPVKQAQTFLSEGARYLHVIDLEGAKSGRPKNFETVLKIIKSINIPVQVGGGIRTLNDARRYLNAGAGRIILTTAAIKNPGTVTSLIAEYGPGRVITSVDAKDGKVAVEGWRKVTSTSVAQFLDRLSVLGVTTIIYTDIKSDGALKGPNFEAVEKVLKKPFKVVVAGGITTLKDAQRLSSMGASGVIIGKALYEGQFNLKQAIAVIPQSGSVSISVRPAKTVTKRIIACMDIANGRVVKGTNFKNLRDAGDPVKLGQFYSDSGIDELVFLDIQATVENRATLYELVRRIAQNINIPFTVGGGVKSLEDIKQLLNAGADKVSIGSAAVTDPDLVSRATKEFGSQCIVISVDPKQKRGSWEIYIRGGRQETGIDALKFCRDMEIRGAGELLVNSLDRDGTAKGYDLDLLQAIGEAMNLPIIASSGAGSLEDLKLGLTEGRADAVLAASLFHYNQLEIKDVKNYLSVNGIPIRI